MNVLVVGGGAREHALTWKALQSPLTDTVFCAPGNAATGSIAINTGLEATDVEGVARFVNERDVGLTVIGPEVAVAAGLADRLTAAGRLVFGPTQAAGRIESSKAFAKSLMERTGVPTPAHRVFDNPASAKDFVRGERRAFVVKADGLAKGKGTLVARDAEETLECIDTLMLRRTVGAAADRIVLEEKIDGREVSLMALVDGERILPLPPACDYKRAFDGDRGPNTGGMGGYSPVSFFGPDAVEQAVTTVLRPIVEGLRDGGTPYRGCLYAGLMVGSAGIQALEFNARFGDPEAQVVLPRLETDLIALLEAAARGELAEASGSWTSRSSVGVVLASRGYPGTYATGYPIEGLGTIEREVLVFHAGAAADPSGYVTAGGRVLTLVALGESMAEAKDRAYRNVDRIRFQGMTFRRDLAEREIEAPALP
ncbi:MAG: phosphoribosylamine--glycine ligase [Chloroflexi bacterium]|nr:MAG: phosphoribosylamine--glycine ligase [Chloroflexota bacterium]TMF19876.1 MAG: phosphoribosylamine--glycine ligase [Chloroflexota bacterium]TMG18994.1 MAG: phosphoribosylamine--glycine ligase [Chloroflexota bacterium]TMG50306.1 MAG: phosphoribosylamine--glycine ligase [Chloroflexota bacterium]